MKFEIRQIDAWQDEPGIWSWNESWHISEYETNAKSEKKAFMRALHKYGVTCKRGYCTIVYDGNIYELQGRKSHEPLFAAIPME